MDTPELPIEIFAAKDAAGAITAVMLAVPRRCGLKQAVALRLDGFKLVAVGPKTQLPFTFPELDQASREALLVSAQQKRMIPVAEFSPVGLFEAYLLPVEAVL